MRIQNNNYNPSFSLWNRDVYKYTASDFAENLAHRNDTSFFRDSTLWYPLLNLIQEKYKSVPKVNVYCYGCSDCSEVYTFLMMLMTHFNKKTANKFLPVIAKDYDPEAISKVKENQYKLTKIEKGKIGDFTGDFNKFFKEIDNNYAALNILTDNVNLSEADIREDYINIVPDNTIIFARNFWPYLTDRDKKTLANNLYNHLGKNSILVIGEFDMSNPYSDMNIESLLLKSGFNPSSIENVLTKP